MLKQKVPWCTSIVMSPERPSFLCAMKGGGPKQGTEGAMIGQLWPASRVILTAQLLPGCLADTGCTSLTNEGQCPVHWGNLSTS